MHVLSHHPELPGGRRVTRTGRSAGRIAGIGGGLVGFLIFVEFTSGVLQGYYIPLLTDIARHLRIHDADVNWLEAAQLMLSAIAVPVLAIRPLSAPQLRGSCTLGGQLSRNFGELAVCGRGSVNPPSAVVSAG